MALIGVDGSLNTIHSFIHTVLYTKIVYRFTLNLVRFYVNLSVADNKHVYIKSYIIVFIIYYLLKVFNAR